MKVRKGTKFKLCINHAWLGTLTRYRRAEFFCEGGPTDRPCERDSLCRIWPGTDIFNADVCTDEAPWPTEWPVNVGVTS